MALWNKHSALYHAIDDWQSRGLLDRETAERLAIDVEHQRPERSFQTILVLLAVICIGFGAITFVAANWDEISRLTRLIIVFGTMWAAWGASILFHAKNRGTIAYSFVLLACILFGAGIMLISQIYHMQGEPRDAVWLWSIGALLAAGLTRSVPSLSFAIILLNIWYFMGNSLFTSKYAIDFSILGYLAIAGALAYWMRCLSAGFLVLISLTLWTCFNALASLDNNTALFLVVVLYACYGLLALALFSEGDQRPLNGFETTLASFFLLNMGTMAYFWYFVAQYEDSNRYSSLFSQSLLIPTIAFVVTGSLAIWGRLKGNRNSYDLIATVLAVAITGALLSLPTELPFVFEAFLVVLSIWVIRMGWRLEYQPISVLGYAGFGVMMMTIYFSTIGTLIGTSAFYLGAGILLLIGVFVLPRLMRKKEKKS